MDPPKNATHVYYWGLIKPISCNVPTEVVELRGKGVIQVASGGFFYLAVTNDGKLYGWGNTKHSRFSLKQPQFIVKPQLLSIKTPISSITAGNWHSVVLDINGLGYSCGSNKNGACGIGSFASPIEIFTPILSKNNFKEVKAGDEYTLFVSKQGDLMSCGHTDFHGHNTKDHVHTPKILPMPQKILTVGAGFTHSLAVGESGAVYSWGDGTFYQLGHGNKNSVKTPKKIEGLEKVKVIQVSCTRGQKNAHSMATTIDGDVYTWGSGYKGKLGHADQWNHGDPADEPIPKKINFLKETPIQKTVAGGIHSMVLSKDGTIYSFGCGSDGRLGHPQSASFRYLYRQGAPRPIEMPTINFIDLQCSYYHSIAVGQAKK